jgi:hypothetical protein
MALSLDGTAQGHVASGTSVSATLTVTNSNDLILAALQTNVAVSSFTAAGLTFTSAPGMPFTSAGHTFSLFSAPASGVFSGSIQANLASNDGNGPTMIVWGVSGANNSLPWDAAAITTTDSNASPLSLNTTNTNTFVIGMFNDDANLGAWAAGKINTSVNFLLIGYAIETTPQSGLAVTEQFPNGSLAAAIAIQAAAVKIYLPSVTGMIVLP